MTIRNGTREDRSHIQSLYLATFPEQESQLVAKLAIELLIDDAAPQIISLVAEADERIVGHVAFSPVTINGDERFRGYILAPLGVKPDYQKRRIGTALVERGIEQLTEMGINVLFVYGDPDYYGRFGFTADAAAHYSSGYRLQYPFGWQAIVLNHYDADNRTVEIVCVNALRDPRLW